eukprot:Opistho-2@72733
MPRVCKPSSNATDNSSAVTAAQSEHQMQDRSALNLVIGCGLVVVHLLSAEDKTLLCGGNALLLLDAFLHSLDLVGRLNIYLDLFAREGLHFDEHSYNGRESR